MNKEVELSSAPSKHNVIIPWLATITWMGIIYWFSDQPNSSQVTEHYLGLWNFLGRKCAHITEYTILFFLCRWSFSSLKHRIISVITAAGLSIAYALLDEWHQSFVIGRSASLQDVLIDSSGVLLGLLTCLVISRISSAGVSPTSQKSEYH